MSVVHRSSPTANPRRLPLTFKLSPKLINELASRQLPFSTSQSEVSGLLYGLVEQSSIVIQTFRPFQPGKVVSGARDRAGQNQILQQHLTAFTKDAETGALQLLGWYALRQEGGLTGSDLTYHNWFFPRPSDLALIIRPDGISDVMLELFCRASTGVLSEEERRIGLARLSGTPVDQPVEVVLGTSVQDLLFMRAYEGEDEEEVAPGVSWKTALLEQSRRVLSLVTPSKKQGQQLAPSQAAATQLSGLPEAGRAGSLSRPNPTLSAAVPAAPSSPLPAPQASPSLVSAPAQLRGTRARPPWIAAALVFIAATGISFGAIYYLRTTGIGNFWPHLFQSASPPTSLGLRLDAQGDRLLLSWNRQDALVRQASNGFLQIVDGAVRRQVVLDRSQVANGSILYHPTSDDISFQLEVRTADGRHEAESMRVLDSAKLPPLDLSPQRSEKREPVIEMPPGESNRVSPNPAAAQKRGSPVPPKLSPSRPPESSGTAPAAKASQPAAETATLPTRAPAQEEFHGIPEDVPEPREAATPVPTAKLEPPTPIQLEPANPQEQPAPSTPVQKRLVTPSSYQPPRPLRQVLPITTTLPPGTLATAGQVEVLVKVNAMGRVTSAQIVPHGRSFSTALTASALGAARQWQFSPALLNAKPVESEHSIVFQFARGR